VARTKRVILALRTLGEPTQSTVLTQGTYTLFAIGQDLMWVTLVSHIPDQAVFWGIEDVVERNSQLNNTQSGP